jgi:hypothetical protein
VISIGLALCVRQKTTVPRLTTSFGATMSDPLETVPWHDDTFPRKNGFRVQGCVRLTLLRQIEVALLSIGFRTVGVKRMTAALSFSNIGMSRAQRS